MSALYGGIEAGGTKLVCALGSGRDEILAATSFPTTTPEETLALATSFLRQSAGRRKIRGVGIGSFGPLDLDPKSPTFGYITTTPKPGWSQVNITGMVGNALNVPVFVDTDVNAAALAESLWGAGQGRDPLVYVTVGTGIGGGVLFGGMPLHGLQHPEIGHMYLPHDAVADPFPGVCPYHGDCLEGLASGPAIAERWKQPAETLPADHQAWDLEAGYLGVALANLACTTAAQAIVLGGGVLQQPHLIDRIRRETERRLNGYIRSPWLAQRLENYIVPAGLGRRAGVLGAIALAAQRH